MKREYNEIQEFIDDVHGELSIREILTDMGLVKNDDFHGQFINCMFHDEDNTPSLQMTEDFWKCYGCGSKGDLFKFLQLYYNIDFIEAVKKLSDFLNINISSIKWNFDAKYSKLKDEWNGYLKSMENAPEEIKKLKRDYFPQEIGYDPSINYIVLALTSKTGAILGFTKRRIGEEKVTVVNGKQWKTPKWRHSSLQDSMISQCHNVFNLHIASPEIRKKKFVIVSEGPKDVIAYQRINFNNSICVCGTSNSSNIWDLIFPVERIVLSMDPDEAGIEATINTLIYLAPIFDIKNIESVVLPNGKDPYDVVTNDGNNALMEYFEQRIPAVHFLIKYGNVDDAKKLYDSVAEYNKIYVIKSICKIKGFSVTEAESWLFSSFENSKNDNKLDEKTMLLAFINGEDIDGVPMMDINRAKRILKLKYGIGD